ncbi:MAG: phosphoribosylglycinamide formyltransferase [Thermoguttaceae bacterium]
MQMQKLKLAVLISGTGRTLHNIIKLSNEGKLSAEVSVVISSTPNAKGLQYAEKEGIPINIIEKKDYETRDEFSKAVFDVCRELKVNYVIMGGYVKLLEIPADFHNRVLNIHPSLVPAFSGKGYYGSLVHEAVLQYGAKLSGCTVHFVDNKYDEGPVIMQRSVDVHENDTPASLNDRIFEQECIAYPEAIQLLAEGRITVDGRRVKIKNKK